MTGAALTVRKRLEKELRQTERLAAAALESLLGAIDANDAETGAHVRRTASYALVLARAADLDDHCCHTVERVALFHDIGKISSTLSDIVRDNTPLSRTERELIATHPQRGADVLKPLAAFYPDLPEGVLSHHERWDAMGYPRKLGGTDIPVYARVVSIADSFDAMTHGRRYRAGQSLGEVIAGISNGRGTQFDPDLVDLFLSPPVFRAIQARMRTNLRPRSTRLDRRAPAAQRERVTDVTFRWQTGSPGREPPDHPLQIESE